MRKKYFAKLMKFIKNVYHIKRDLYKQADGRLNSTYSIGKVILPVLISFLASKYEGELNVSKRLMSSVVKSHKNFIDVLVYDVLN